jgi:hypothetical protein
MLWIALLLVHIVAAVVFVLLGGKSDNPELVEKRSMDRVLRKNGLLGRRD